MSLIMYQSGIKQEKAYSKFYRIRPWTVLELIKCLWKAGAFVSGPGQTVGKGRLNVTAETKGKMKPARMSWYPCLSLTSYNSSEEGGLQKMLVPSPWIWKCTWSRSREKLKEEIWENLNELPAQLLPLITHVSQETAGNVCELHQYPPSELNKIAVDTLPLPKSQWNFSVANPNLEPDRQEILGNVVQA